jgi:hypothetical protein
MSLRGGAPGIKPGFRMKRPAAHKTPSEKIFRNLFCKPDWEFSGSGLSGSLIPYTMRLSQKLKFWESLPY